MDPMEQILQLFGVQGTNKSASNVPPQAFQNKNIPFEDIDPEKAALMRSSVHGTNASERATRMQAMENSYENAEDDLPPDDIKNLDATDSGISDKLWKTIQQVGNREDGEDFYKLPGKEAFATLGMDTESNADLADFWDRMSPEDRYYIVRALDSSIGGAASNEDIMEDTSKQKAADEQSVIDMMMDMNK